MNRLIRLAPLALCTVLLGTAHASCAAPKDMNGVWRANDGGTYYVRQQGDQIWWVGMSSDTGKTWTNVFQGIRTGNVVKGTWADVPRGKSRNTGSLTLNVSGVNSVLGFKRSAETGSFSGSTWYQTCDDVILNPVP